MNYTKTINRRRVTSGLLVVAMLFSMLAGTLAFFTDRAETQATATAGTVSINFDDSGINLKDADGKDIFNPGDGRDFNYTVTNTGNKSIDVRETIVLTAYDKNGNALPLADTQSEFEIYLATDVTYDATRGWVPNDGVQPIPVKVLDNNTITYTRPAYTLNGNSELDDSMREIEDGITVSAQTSEMKLIFKGTASNKYQGAVLKADVVVEAKQHRNTEGYGDNWLELQTATHVLSNGNTVVIVPGNEIAINPSEDFEVVDLGNDKIKIAGLTDIGANKETLVIPSVITDSVSGNTYTVTEIDWEEVFNDSNNTKINNNDTNIPQPADNLVFNYTSDGTKTTITGLTDDGKKLTYVKFPETIDGEDTTFDDNFVNNTTGGDTNVEIPDSVIEDLDSSVILDYEVVDANNVTILGLTPFGSSVALNNLEIPAEIEGVPVTKINNSAFAGDTYLSGTLTIPSSVTWVGYNLVAQTAVDTVNIDIADGATLYINNGYETWSNSSVTEINYTNENLTALPAYAFASATKLTSYSYPAGITAIPDYAFYDCSSITEMPDLTNITSIGRSAFQGCTGLSGEVTLGDNLTFIGNQAFADCSGLTGTLNIPAATRSVGMGVISNTNITTVNLDVTNGASIRLDNGHYAWYGSNVTEINYTNDALTELPAYAFADAKKMTTYSYPNSVTKIGDYAFYGCSSISEFPDLSNVTYIGNNAFNGLSQIATLPDFTNVTYIGEGAFYGCSGMTGQLVFGNNLTDIRGGAFQGCTGLTGELVIPASVKTIGSNAFKGCTGLTGTLNIPASVTSIGSYVIEKTQITTVNVAGTPNVSEGAWSYSNVTEINYTKEGMTTLPAYAFSGASKMTTYSYPDTVTVIGEGAFKECSSMTTMPDFTNITAIGAYAFRNTGISGTLTLGNGMTSISNNAFQNCRGLTEVYIPASVTSIDNYAFNGCSGITTIHYSGSAANANNNWGASNATVVAD